MILEYLGGALEAGQDRGGNADLPLRLLDLLTASPSEMPGARLNEIVTAGSCPDAVMLSGAASS